MASDLPQAIASGLIPGLTIAVISALMTMRHDRAAIVGGRKILSYGIGTKLLGVLGCGMTAVPIGALIYNISELVDHPFKYLGVAAMSGLLIWVFWPHPL